MSVDSVLQSIGISFGPLDPESVRAVGGGSINRCFALTARDGRRVFLKLNNDPAAFEMFEAESEGLAALATAGALRVPAPLVTGVTDTAAYLLMEYLEFDSKTSTAAAALGTRLARQHRQFGDAFGWHRANTIGSTPQLNRETSDWLDFWREARLGYQLRLARDNGLAARVVRQGDELLARLPEFFDDYRPEPSLLHGDLWGGNWGATVDGEAVIFDPAVYYGDRETDIAMTMLFGGFGPEFLDAYDSEWPLHPGFRRRVDLYNLYHVLNHFNLFGGGYRQQAAGLLDRLLTCQVKQ